MNIAELTVPVCIAGGAVAGALAGAKAGIGWAIGGAVAGVPMGLLCYFALTLPFVILQSKFVKSSGQPSKVFRYIFLPVMAGCVALSAGGTWSVVRWLAS